MVMADKMNFLAELLSSRVKAEMFRLLFGISDKPIHLRELERQSGLAIGTVQQELKRLTRLGIVRVQPDGNRTCYWAEKGHPLYPEIHGLVMKTTGLVSTLEAALAPDSIQVAFVFGSVASGNPTARSDIDLMVIGTITLRQLTARLAGLSHTLGREINPHVLTPEEFARRRSSGDHFLTTIFGSPMLFVKGGRHELEAMG